MCELSVIVPVYNAEKTILKCVESIKLQTMSNICIILVDDGSIDSSGEICAKLSADDNRIMVIHKKNDGVSSARNVGIDNANTKYIMFVDSDDYISEDMCETLLNNIKYINTDMSVCGFKQIFVSNNRVINTKLVYPLCDNIVDEQSFSMQFGKLYNNTILISPCFKIYNLNLIKEYNIRFNEEISLGEDLIFNQEYLKISRKIAVINKCLYNYIYEDKDTLSKSYDPYRFRTVEYLYIKSKEFCEEVGIWNENKKYIIDLFLRNSMICIETCLSEKRTKKELFKIISMIAESINMNMQKQHIVNQYVLLFNTKNSYIIAGVAWLRWKVKRVLRSRKI